jgi:uncharacterized phage-like protein YoqJ
MARIDIEIEEYLDEVDTKYLVQELNKRKDRNNYRIDIDDYDIPIFKDSEQLLKYIKRLLGLRQWHDKNRVISEIKEL